LEKGGDLFQLLKAFEKGDDGAGGNARTSTWPKGKETSYNPLEGGWGGTDGEKEKKQREHYYMEKGEQLNAKTKKILT